MDVPGKVKVGEFEIAMLSDGLWRNDGGCMFGVVPRELWQRDHPGDERNRIRLNLTCPLIMRGALAVLVDTGIGNRLSAVERKIFDHGEGWLLDGLKALVMEAGDVTHVVLSHLHFDHCGGIVRRRPSGALEAAFPRARVMVQPPGPPSRSVAAICRSTVREVSPAGAVAARPRVAERHLPGARRQRCRPAGAGLGQLARTVRADASSGRAGPGCGDPATVAHSGRRAGVC